MRNAAWVVVGWLGVVFWSALCSRLRIAHIVPDAAVVTVVFLALRREPLLVALSALLLGYLVGRETGAATGLHETALVACAIGVYVVSGNITGSGPWFFAAATGVAVMAYHGIMLVLQLAFGGHAGFASVATAMLLPSALATAALAVVSYPWMIWLEHRLFTERHEDLSWR